MCRGSNNSEGGPDFGYSGKLVELSRCDCDYIFVSCTLEVSEGGRMAAMAAQSARLQIAQVGNGVVVLRVKLT